MQSFIYLLTYLFLTLQSSSNFRCNPFHFRFALYYLPLYSRVSHQFHYNPKFSIKHILLSCYSFLTSPSLQPIDSLRLGSSS
ncbi:hypothetical protein OROMI_005266 [Orobanche minor]